MANKRRQQSSTPETSAVEAVLGTLWALITLPFRQAKTNQLDSATARELALHWSTIVDHLAHPATEAMAVSEADKLLDAALKAMGFEGDKTSDRLRAAEDRLGKALSNEVWRAHKLRNALAHEVGMQLAPGQAAVAVSTFQRALRALGVSV